MKNNSVVTGDIRCDAVEPVPGRGADTQRPVGIGDNSCMPTYAYRCRECTETFELQRPMSESSAPAACPDGHADTVKLLTTIALTGSAGGSTTPAAVPAPTAGGCCGGGCCG